MMMRMALVEVPELIEEDVAGDLELGSTYCRAQTLGEVQRRTLGPHGLTGTIGMLVSNSVSLHYCF